MRVNNRNKLDSCPLCRSTAIRSCGSLSYSGMVRFSSTEIELEVRPELWSCRNCASRFVQHAVDEATAKMLYSSGRADERWSTELFEQRKSANVVKRMKLLFKGQPRVLDVGSNTGELLDLAKGTGCYTAGVEYSASSRAVMQKKGHQVYASMDEAPGGFDLITAFDLVEHLHDVPTFMEACRSRLNPGGRLVILTGDIDSLSARIAGRSWWYAQYPEHIMFPSRQYFMERSGLELDEWLPTYAAQGYQSPPLEIVWRLLKDMLRFRRYTGLPSLGPDHALAVLVR